MPIERVIAYIDGYNLYFGLTASTWQWNKWILGKIMKHTETWLQFGCDRDAGIRRQPWPSAVPPVAQH